MNLSADYQQDKIGTWLQAPDPSTIHNQALRQRHKDSGRWFLGGEAFAKWKIQQNSFLWLHGIPGCGKTILSSTIVQDLESTLSSHPLLYFYFTFTESDRQSLEGMIRSLIGQLYYKREDVRKPLDSLFSNCSHGRRQPTVDSLCRTFRQMLQQVGEVWIVLDALDECNTRSGKQTEGTLSWMRDLLSSEENNAHVLVTSRPEQDIESEVREWVLDDDMLLTDALASLPKTLDETYARILNSIPESHRHKAIRILQLLIFSERPLLIEEIVDAVAVGPKGERHFNPENRMPVPREILRYCSSLVVVVTVRGYLTNWEELQLAHSSVKEYLTSSRVETQFSQDLQETTAKASIAIVCLAYLMHLDQDLELEEIKRTFPFAQYCGRYWMEHAAECKEQGDELRLLTMELLLHKKAYTNSYRLCPRDQPWLNPSHLSRASPPAALYYTSLGGLANAVGDLIQKGADANALGGRYGTALQAASAHGHTRVVKLLLSQRAEVNVKGGHYGTALQAASLEGHNQIVDLLLSHGAEVNAQGPFGNTALQLALREGHDRTIELLLSHGAKANSEGGHYGTVLQAASYRGHDQIVELLLSRGAEINVEGGSFGTALQAASYQGHDQIVELLLNRGADINAEGGPVGTALQAASSQGHDQIVELLLNRGADINSEGGPVGTALQAASSRGHGQIVELLLSRGAKINAEGGPLGTALQAASYRGHDWIVDLLLSRGAKVNAQGPYGTALQAASFRGHESMVELLLSRGANVNAEGKYRDVEGEYHYGNALDAASRGGHDRVVKLLLSRGANVDVEGGPDGTSLQAASGGGYDRIVELLLSHGAKANAEGGPEGTALQAASFRGHERIVELLLSHGAKVNAEGGSSGTALLAASFRGHERIVEMLLSMGANVNVEGKYEDAIGEYYGTALQAASIGDHERTVELLLSRGANVNAEGRYRDARWEYHHGNALDAALRGGHDGIIKLLRDAQAEHYGNAM
ncbi:MAG: hypothetical protein M1823_003976 [Watsoniomyces obsoletus]|nr:MAG: hypothetical protein M1823_003976 [Watsoniomyces obsoletus]